MSLRDFGEKELIRRFIRPHLALSSADLDDCAFLPLGNGSHFAITIDAGPRTPFLRVLKVGTPFDLGHYFATMTLSDLAAVGAVPSAVVAAYLLPEALDVQFVTAVAAGVAAACAQDGAEYVGGDTKSAAELRIVTSGVGVTKRPLRRTGVSDGDLLFVSGPLGVSLRSYIETRHDPQLPVHRPRARVSFGRWLSDTGIASTCLDMSDGPLSAVADLARANNAEISFNVEALQIERRPRDGSLSDREWLVLTLGTGADFELMFTASAKYRGEIVAKGGIECGRIQAVGTSALVVYDRPELLGRYWEHFATSSNFEDILRHV